MQNESQQEPVALTFIDADFLIVELDINRCSVEAKWLRQVSSEEYQRGLEMAFSAAFELKTELKRISALVQACKRAE